MSSRFVHPVAAVVSGPTSYGRISIRDRATDLDRRLDEHLLARQASFSHGRFNLLFAKSWRTQFSIQ
jgi:hypothetical protein